MLASLHVSQAVPAKPGAQVVQAGACQPTLGVWLHCWLVASQASSVHGSPSWQLAMPAHWRSLQMSPVVHASLSSHVAVLAAAMHTPPAQVSVLQGLPSSQFLAVPVQLVPTHASPNVQALLSVHVASTGSIWQPIAGAQSSLVHGLPSSQDAKVPAHRPTLHLSAIVHALPSSQELRSGAGIMWHLLLLPSHSPSRHLPSPGQVLSSVWPLQLLSRPSHFSTPPLLTTHDTHVPLAPQIFEAQSVLLVQAQPTDVQLLPSLPASPVASSLAMSSSMSSSLVPVTAGLQAARTMKRGRSSVRIFMAARCHKRGVSANRLSLGGPCGILRAPPEVAPVPAITPVPFTAKLRALAFLRCPNCRVGPMFRTPVHMHARCPNCDYQFDKGNGYFLGAMYASYGLSLAVCGAQTIGLLLAGASTLVTIVAAIVTACIVGPCFAFPYSRCAWVWAEREGHLHDGEEDVQKLKRDYMAARGMTVKPPQDPP